MNKYESRLVISLEGTPPAKEELEADSRHLSILLLPTLVLALIAFTFELSEAYQYGLLFIFMCLASLTCVLFDDKKRDTKSLNELSEMIESESSLCADNLIARKLIADYVAQIQAMGRKVIAGEFETLCRARNTELEVAEEVKAQRKLDSTLSPK
jgi:hypothetical protein|tara:strand:- start:154 stop:618 length:465 start_codon:yes stop_codon:yes gene_type:complete